eukprot:gene13483-28580_t
MKFSPILAVIGFIGFLDIALSYRTFPTRRPNNNGGIKSFSKLNLGPMEFIPAAIVTCGVVFAVFNIDNKVDLTDAGQAATRAKRRAELKSKGELPKPSENLDPYRWGADDDSDIDILPSRKSGGVAVLYLLVYDCSALDAKTFRTVRAPL